MKFFKSLAVIVDGLPDNPEKTTALRKLRGAQASKTNRREPVPPLGLGPVPDGWNYDA